MYTIYPYLAGVAGFTSATRRKKYTPLNRLQNEISSIMLIAEYIFIDLDWPTLQERRRQSSRIKFMEKIINKSVAIPEAYLQDVS